MKIETTELIAAAHVLELAKQRQSSAWATFANEHGHAPAQPSGARSMWIQGHPVSNFVPQVVKELTDVALLVRTITSPD